MMKNKNSKQKTAWLWEFSKRVVIICFILYVIGFFYSGAVMVISGDYSNLGVFIEQLTNVLITCVFGYFVKAGMENIFKIKRSGSGDMLDPDTSSCRCEDPKE